MSSVADCPLCRTYPAQVFAHPGRGSEHICPACGRFVLTLEANLLLRSMTPAQVLPVCWFARAKSTPEKPALVDTTAVERMTDGSSRPASLLDVTDTVIREAADHHSSHGLTAFYELRGESFVRLRLRGENDIRYLVRTLSSELALARTSGEWGLQLTSKGWARAAELAQSPRSGNQVFVAMWFSDEMTSAFDAAIFPAAEGQHYRAYRVDREHFENKIDDQILAEIRRSRLLIADFTGNRGGVYFEAGFALGLGIPVIWTCRRDWLEKVPGEPAKGVHFDTRQYPFIVWATHDDLREQLSARIAALYPLRSTLD